MRACSPSGRAHPFDPHPGKIENSVTVVNRYAYVGNNSLNYTDPTGKFWWLALSVVISFAINYTTSINSGATVGQALISGLIGGISGLIAPGVGSYLVGQGFGAVTSLIIGNIAAGFFSGAAHAAAFGGDIGMGTLLGGAGGLVAGVLQIGAGAAIYDIGFNRVASRFLSEPFGYFGGLAINSGQEFPREEAPNGTIIYRPVPAH